MVFFFILVKPYLISPIFAAYHEKNLVPAFFKVSTDHLFDNLMSGKKNYLFGKTLEKVLNFGSMCLPDRAREMSLKLHGIPPGKEEEFLEESP